MKISKRTRIELVLDILAHTCEWKLLFPHVYSCGPEVCHCSASSGPALENAPAEFVMSVHYPLNPRWQRRGELALDFEAGALDVGVQRVSGVHLGGQLVIFA